MEFCVGEWALYKIELFVVKVSLTDMLSTLKDMK